MILDVHISTYQDVSDKRNTFINCLFSLSIDSTFGKRKTSMSYQSVQHIYKKNYLALNNDIFCPGLDSRLNILHF